jgi:hypothetical protein
MGDIIFGGSSHSHVSRFQEMMENEFWMSMMGELTFFLGIHVKQMKQGTFVYQAKYMKDLIKKFNMAELKPVSTRLCVHFQASPCSSHRTVGQRIFRYLKHTLEFGIWYYASSSLDLVGFLILILWVVGLTKRALLGLVIFLDHLSFAGLLKNNLQLPNPPHRLSI